MAVTSTQLAPVTRKGTKSGRNLRDREGLGPDAAFRRKYGIPPAGKRNAPDSSWGFPVPPPTHPQAKQYARAVLSRAHQNGSFLASDVQKQVRKANKILYGKPNPTDKDKQKAHEGARAVAEAALKRVHTAPNKDQQRGAFARALNAQREYQLVTGQYFESKESEVPVQVYLGIREAVLDTQKGTARVILITEGPGNLADRHWYTAESLTRAVSEGVFDGAQCFLDHPTELEDRTQPERTVTKLAGWYSDAVLGDYKDPKLGTVSAIYAQFHPQVGNEKVLELLRTAMIYAEKFPDKSYIGYSINAIGTGERAEINGEPWNRVDCLSEVVSVDIVTKAGARGKPIAFREAAEMAARSTRKPNRQGSAASRTTTGREGAKRKPISTEKLLEVSRKRLLASLRGKTSEEKRKLYESFAGINREERRKQMLAEGVDGANVARILDELSDSGIEQLTGVHPDEIGDEPEDDECEHEEEFGDGESAGGLMDPTHGESEHEENEFGEGEHEESEHEESEHEEDAALGAANRDEPMPKDPKEVKRALQASRREADTLRKKLKAKEREVREALGARREAEIKLKTKNVERIARDVLNELNIHENRQPRLLRLIQERAHPNYQGFEPIRTAADIKKFVREEDLYARASSPDGAGVIGRNSGGKGNVVAAPGWKKAGA